MQHVFVLEPCWFVKSGAQRPDLALRLVAALNSSARYL